MSDERCRAALELAEHSVDNWVDDRSLDLASESVQEAYEEALGAWMDGMSPIDKSLPCEAASSACERRSIRIEDAITVATAASASVDRQVDEQVAQANLLRDIYPNPFRPVVADPAWFTPTVQSIASAIYADRAFDRLPILADALEEAGCTNADVLLHCRQPGEHVRGCWVVDLVLGKQ